MQLRFLCGLLLFVPLTQNAVSQQTINFRTYSTADGLPYGTIRQLWQDERGFVWLLAENGLSRFDGFEFISYRNMQNNPKSLASSSVYKAFNGPDNRVYFQTSTSISRYNYADETFENLIRFSGYTDVKWIGAHKNTFYSWCESGLYTIKENADTAHYFRLPEFVSGYPRLQVFQMEDALFTYNSNTLAKVHLTTGKTIRLTAQLKDGTVLKPDQMSNVFFYKSENGLYLSTFQHLFKFDKKAAAFQEINARMSELHYSRNSLSPQRIIDQVIYKLEKNNKIFSLDLSDGHVDSLNLNDIKGIQENFEPYFILCNSTSSTNLWIAGQSSGILLLNRKTLDPLTANVYHTGNSNLKSNNFNAILDVDPNVIWLYSPGFGLVKGERTKFLFRSFNPDTLSKKDIPTNSKNVRALYSYGSDTIYAGTLTAGQEVGLFPRIDIKKIIPSPIAAIISDRNNNLWFSAWGQHSIYTYNPLTKRSQPIIVDSSTSSYSENFARTLWCGKDNSIYYVTSGKQLYQLKPVHDPNGNTRYESFKYNFKGQKLNTVFAIEEFRNNQLLLGSSNGLYIYDLSKKNISRFYEESPSARLFNRSDIRSINVSSDYTIWVGTNGNGLFRYSLKDKTCKNYTTETGLFDNSIYAILRDKKENIWMSSNKGIFKLDPLTGTSQSFSYKDGISFEEFNTNAATVFPDGKMAFGGTGGLVVFHPDSILKSINVKRPILLRMMVNNQPLPIKESYHLDHQQNYISIQFASLEQFRQDEFSYAYQLEGLDPDWIYCGKRRFTSYANLQPGDYFLKIKCTNYNGIWNDNILRIPVKIDKPWYQTWLFIACLIIAVSGMIYGLFRIRLNQRTKLLLIRDNIARDLHDEIGANLSTISIYSEIAKENLLKNKEGVPTLLDKISAYTQMSQESMSDIVWMIDSRNDKFENVILKMRNLASETIGASPDIQLHMQIDEEIHHLKIGMKQRKNFYMIYKECLNNISKYAHCQNVWINLRDDQHSIFLEITDDGIGFEPGKTKGNGLVYMKKRAADIPGEISVHSSPGKGTSIKLRFRH